ncbi:MFS family permease [Pullulanibacillus pueri]|uniref:MFS transporter n=1 Tax=Pullulanibacillus pueri TaxID=1437324 RepID=A0A8J2ZZ30_9BACL|nr:MFS transporter [Pullulanibacillus pueri]MBM7681689.1 MFS family permease [Pullulanibacillus pueri]GGH87023.1 MFS transporter [Pullulanibacillus pueri]
MVEQVEEVANAPSHEGLFRNYKFISLWLAGAVSSFSLSVYLLSEEWYVVTGLNLGSMLGIVMMVTLIPRVIFMFVGGTLSDRIERKKLLFLSDFIRGILVGLMALLVFLGILNIWVLLFFAFAFGSLDAFYWPANRSFLPFLVHEDQLTRANSVIQGTNQMLMMAGPAFGAVLIHWVGFKGVFAITALLLLVGSLLNLAIRETAKPRANGKQAPLSIFKDFKETLAYIKTEPYLITSMGTSIVINFLLSSPLSVGLPLLVKNVMHGNSYHLSLMEGGITFGMFLGAVIAGVFNFKKKRAILNLSLIGIDAIFIFGLSEVVSLWAGVLCIVFIGLFIAIGNVIGPALSQSYIKKEQMGRVQSLMSMSSMGLMPLSFALVSCLLSVGLSISFLLVASSILTLIFVVLVLVFVRSLWRID